MSYNKIIIIGYLGRDPEMRYLPSGDPVTNFSVATSYSRKKNDGIEKETEWFNIAAWNRLAEITNQYLRKGSQVYIEGRLSSRTYVGGDNQVRVSLDVNADKIQFLSTNKDNIEHTGTSSYDDDNLPW